MATFICRVSGAGSTEDGSVLIKLTNTGNDPQFSGWFIAAAVPRREMLATALTAISTGYKVEAHLSDTVVDTSEVHRLYLLTG